MAISIARSPMVRRWYIMILGLLATGALMWGSLAVAPVHYTGRGLVMLLPSRDLIGPNGNPLLNLGGLELPARVLVAYYASQPVQSELEAFAPEAEVGVTIEPSTAGPIIAVDVGAASPEEVLRVLEHVVDSVPTSLASIQADLGAKGNAAMRAVPLVVDNEAKRDYATGVRLILAAAVVGLVITLAATFAVDGLLSQRAAKRTPPDESQQDSLPEELAPAPPPPLR